MANKAKQSPARQAFKAANLSPADHALAGGMADHLTARQMPGLKPVSIPQAFMALIRYYEEREGVKIQPRQAD